MENTQQNEWIHTNPEDKSLQAPVQCIYETENTENAIQHTIQHISEQEMQEYTHYTQNKQSAVSKQL